MQAIRTVYHGPTNYRGARITATCSSGYRATINYPHELDTEDAHRKAAVALMEKMEWNHLMDNFASGCFKGDFYHVFTG